MTHLDALNLRLSNERARLAVAKSAGEVALRTVWIAGIEREIAGELAFLASRPTELPDLSDDDLLSQLSD